MKQNKHFRDELEKVPPEIKQEMEWSCTIVDHIDFLLKKNNMTQRDLARKMGCNETQITRWTRGFPNYTLHSLAKLSQALGESLITPAGGD